MDEDGNAHVNRAHRAPEIERARQDALRAHPVRNVDPAMIPPVVAVEKKLEPFVDRPTPAAKAMRPRPQGASPW